VAYATKAHYEANKQYYIDKALKRGEMIKEFVRSKKDVPCTDCGIKYPFYVMQFDHLSDKSFQIGNGTRSGSLSKLQSEIDKCEVVCANCHAERTYRRRLK
jgi:hypothetical protein